MSQALHPATPIDLYENYQKHGIAFLKEKYSLSPMAIPVISKVVLSTSLGSMATEKGYFKAVGEHFALIACRKPVVAKAKKSIAAFKVREGMDVGYYVTLRRRAMYDFLNRFVYITLPRVRDFKGLNKNAFDSNYNYNIGVRDCSSFHEVDVISLGKTFGLNVAISIKNVTSREQAIDLMHTVFLPVR